MQEAVEEAVDVAVQLKYDRIREESNTENQQFLDSIDEGMKKVIKEQLKKEVSKITRKIEKLVNEQLECEVLVRSSKEANTSHAVAANLSELELKKILINKMEANNSINRSDIQRQLYKALVDAYEADKILLDTYGDTTRGPKEEGQEKNLNLLVPQEKRQPRQQERLLQEFETGVHDEQAIEEVLHLPDWFQQPKRLPSPDHAWNKSVPVVHESVQPWLSNLARRQDPQESFDELTDTTFDFSAFVMNRLNVKTLTPELLAGPTFELMKGTCKSLTELEYFCEEVYKATTEKLDWINPEGRQYPHDLRQPLPLVPNSQGRHVIPFHHFINNDLEYLRGGESSRKESHIGAKKRRQFYAFATTRESTRDVYSKRRIIAVTKVEIVEWQNYKHLDWITVRRDDDVLYKFKEGDFHRLRIQDIEDMLLLLVQGKVTNLNVEERIAFNVSLRMFTRSVVIQRRVEDLQLGVESYQKKLNLTKPDTYRSNLRRRDAYTPYSDPRGFIYENKDKKNRLMRIVEDHTGVTYGFYKGPYDLSYVVLILKRIHDEIPKEDSDHVLKFVRFKAVRLRYSDPYGLPELEVDLTASEGYLKRLVEVTDYSWLTIFHYSDTAHLSRSDKVLKLKNFKKDATLKLSNHQLRKVMELVGPERRKSQMAKLQDGEGICLVDDLKDAQDHNSQIQVKEQAQSRSH
ncbi:hypothetical protein Tco_0708253 [Tanacetum coccineum]